MRISGVDSTDLFRGNAARPLQIVRVRLVNDGPGAVSGSETALVTLDGPAVSTPEPARVTGVGLGTEVTVEVGVEIAAPAQPGSSRQVLVRATGPSSEAELAAVITVAEPGWVMWMVSHFHYDPVW